MNKKHIRKQAERFVKERLRGESTGHDWWHIYRVLRNAERINRTEGGDEFVIALAVLLHDVGDRKVIGQEEDDYGIAESFLRKQGVDEDTTQQVMHIIKHMSFSASLNKKREGESIEFYVVQDADRFDAIGAIGIARAFAYGGSRGRPLYDPTKKAQSITSTKKYRALRSSTFHHFEEKLLHVKDLMHTKTAERIAHKRHLFMQKYLDQFLAEWEGGQ